MPFARPPEPVAVAEGDIWQLGRHRLMCGDATDKEAVARLFDGRKPTLVVTSPPYAKQRNYDRPIACWDSMMIGALDGPAFSSDVQMLVNLGPYHQKNEIVFYWHEWLQTMRGLGWRHFSQYVWNKQLVAPGCFGGRMSPSHEFIHHINRETVKINKWEECKYRGHTGSFRTDVKSRNGVNKVRTRIAVNSHRAPRSVISVLPVDRWRANGHPAQMPQLLAEFLIRSWKKKKCVAYDCFAGSGTTLLACEQEDVDGLGMEISPAYCQIAIDRWNKTHPMQAASLVSRA